VRRIVVIGAVALAFAAASSATAARRPPTFPRIAGSWFHVELNMTIAGKPHTLILDRGRIRRATALAVTVHERDGNNVDIPLAPTTVVQLNGRPVPAVFLVRGMPVEIMRVDGGAAVRVDAGRRR